MQSPDEKTKVDAPPSHLENILSNETDANLKDARPHFAVDAELEKYINSGIVIDEAANAKVLKLVRFHLSLPIFLLGYVCSC